VRSLYLQPFGVRGSTQAPGSTQHTRKEQLDVFDRILFSVEVREVFVLLCPGF